MGADADDGQRPPVARADPLHAQSRRGRSAAGQRRFSAAGRAVSAIGSSGVRRSSCMVDDGDAPATSLEIAGEYEALLAAVFPDMTSRTSTRTPARRFSTRPARPGCPRACTSATASSCCTRSPRQRPSGRGEAGQRFIAEDVYMPITPMFHVHAWGLPYRCDHAGHQAGLSGPLRRRKCCCKLIKTEKVTFSHCVPDDPADAADAADQRGRRPSKAEDGDRRLGADQGTGQAGNGPRHRRFRRLRHVRNLSDPDAWRISSPAMLDRLADEQDEVRDPDGHCRCRWSTSAIVDAEMNDVPHDGKSTGEIVVRAPWLTHGYFKNPEALRTALAGRLPAHRRHRVR